MTFNISAKKMIWEGKISENTFKTYVLLNGDLDDDIPAGRLGSDTFVFNIRYGFDAVADIQLMIS